MKTIFYGVCGNGSEHCNRVLALVENMNDIDFHIFTYGDTYKDLKLAGITNLHRIQGLEFKNLFQFLTKGIHQNKALLHKIAKQHKPDLLLTDWEPSVPRMASELSVPCLSLDSQHKFKFSNY